MQGLDLAAKPLGKAGAAAQARKRLSRKSPGPELRKTLRSIPPPTNVTGPETVSVTFILNLHKMFFFISRAVYFSIFFCFALLALRYNGIIDNKSHQSIVFNFSLQLHGRVKYSVGCTVTW